MSRPVPIAALDEALEVQLLTLVDAEKEFERILAENIKAVSAVDEAASALSAAFYGARGCEDAIRKLGYVVLGVRRDESRLDGHRLGIPARKAAALWRAGLPGGLEPNE